MDVADCLQYLLIAVTLLAMLSASLSDYRRRIVSDRPWIIIGSLGIGINALCGIWDNGLSWAYLAVPLAEATLLFGIFCPDDVSGALAVVFSVIVSLNALFYGNYTSGAVAVLLGALFVLAYYAGIIRGGADTKCLIVIGMAMPSWEGLGMIDISYVPDLVKSIFVPSVSVLMIASVFSVVGCSLYCLMMNKGQAISLCRYQMPVASVANSHVWPCERLVDGERHPCGIPDDDEVGGICRSFMEAGIDRIYVTPKMPFIVPMAAALALIVVVGNPIFTI